MLLDLLYIWTDFPDQLRGRGDAAVLCWAIPLALPATGAFARFLDRGGFGDWLLAAVLLSLAFLVHLTTAMVIAPAATLAYAHRCVGSLRPLQALIRHALRSLATSATCRRPPTALVHLAVWVIPIVVLAVNAFWWLPGIWLASTKGPSDFAFAHPEGVATGWCRSSGSEAPIQCVLLLAGRSRHVLAVTPRSNARAGHASGFARPGMFWGYLAGGCRALDFLQPGRHTYAFYTALAVAGGAALRRSCVSGSARSPRRARPARLVGHGRRRLDRRAADRISAG